MGRLSAFADSEQLSLDDALAEFRDASPSEGVVAGEKGTSMIMAGTEREGILSLAALVGDEKGTGPHDGDCPYIQQCESERQQRPYYLPSTCHWRAFGDWRRCKKYNGGTK